MKKIVIALTALAGITFLSGCAYDGYNYGDHYAYGYGYARPYHNFYGREGLRYDCINSFDATLCG
ncbi:MAG TPA: hypothetical protein VFW28_20230 [Micropepsaceae bacterium]|nr:hypothetical protein [Micropepsaceae bacterium]